MATETNENHFGNAVRARRIELGYSQTELAGAMGTRQMVVSQIENGREPEMPTLKRLAKALCGDIVIRESGDVEFIGRVIGL